MFNLPRLLYIYIETCCCHYMGYSFRLAARYLLYAPSQRQDSTYHSFCYTSHGALAGMRNSSMGPLWRIDPKTYRSMSESLLPRSYISLPAEKREIHKTTSGVKKNPNSTHKRMVPPLKYVRNCPCVQGRPLLVVSSSPLCWTWMLVWYANRTRPIYQQSAK